MGCERLTLFEDVLKLLLSMKRYWVECVGELNMIGFWEIWNALIALIG